jgi:AcrR family transcriptional regulator
MEAAANHITRYGYAEMVVDQVASDAGYTRGALYHLFATKEELVLAVVAWVLQAWDDEAGHLLDDDTDPVGTLIAVAHAFATYSRHDPARVLTRLRAEFAGTDHPIEKAINELRGDFCEIVARLITAGRTNGVIPPGPPTDVMAIAYMGAIDGVVSHLVDQEPFDALFAEKATLGVLGLPPASIP